jgi:hypothetical protein
MEFTLTYRGALGSNGDPNEKHILRRHFHKQLKELWQQPPLQGKIDSASRPFYEQLSEQVGPFRFVPLVSSRFSFTASLHVTFLRPGYPGQLFRTGGDIDNRMKTLLDALTKPPENQIPKGDVPQADENPFYCLLQDDALITGFSVATDRLLDCQGDREALVLIRVETRCHLVFMVNDI